MDGPEEALFDTRLADGNGQVEYIGDEFALLRSVDVQLLAEARRPRRTQAYTGTKARCPSLPGLRPEADVYDVPRKWTKVRLVHREGSSPPGGRCLRQRGGERNSIETLALENIKRGEGLWVP
ncbi:hypothetical protein Landi51_04621 [Colletotrichum acutatum]